MLDNPSWLALLSLWVWCAPAWAGDWTTVPLVDGYEVTLSAHGLAVDATNRPHILWDGDRGVRHAMRDGGWSIEALPTDRDYVYGVSAAKWGGEVVAVWSQRSDLHWSTGLWGDWSPERVGDGFHLYGGSWPVVDVAPSGLLQLFAESLGIDGGDYLRVLRYDGDVEGWNQIAVVAGERGQLAFDSTSVPWYVWEDAGDLVYSSDGWMESVPPVVFPPFLQAQPFATIVDGQDRLTIGVQEGEAVNLYRLVGVDWSSETIGLATPQPRAPALDVDPGGAVHAVFVDDLTLEVRHVVEGPTGGWTTEIAHHEFPGELAVEATNTEVHVAHVRDHTLRYGLRDAQGDWTWEEVARSSRPGFGLSALHDGDRVWAAHVDGVDPDMPARLWLTSSDGTTTEHQLVAEHPPDGLYPDTELALGTDGSFRLTRVDADGPFIWPEIWSSELVLMAGAPGAWTESVVSRPGDAPLTHALALHPVTDDAVVAYVTPNPSLEDAYQLVLARQSGAGWTHEVLHDDASYVDVEVGADGTVHVGFRDEAASLVRYLSDVGATWTDTVVDDTNATGLGCGRQLQLALDPADQPHFVYACREPAPASDAIWRAWMVAAQWDYDQVLSGSPRSLAVHVDDTWTTRVVANTLGTVWLADDAGNHFSADAVGSGAGAVALAMGPDDEVFVPWQDDDRWDLNLSLAQLDLDVQPGVVDFGGVGVGSSAEQPVTVTNVGSTLVSLPLPQLAGPHPFAFELVGVCGDLQPGDSCTWTVRFVPDEVLDRVATLAVAPGHEVVLTGTGQMRFVVDTSGCSDGCGSDGGCATGGGPVLPWALVLVLVARRRFSQSP